MKNSPSRRSGAPSRHRTPSHELKSAKEEKKITPCQLRTWEATFSTSIRSVDRFGEAMISSTEEKRVGYLELKEPAGPEAEQPSSRELKPIGSLERGRGIEGDLRRTKVRREALEDPISVEMIGSEFCSLGLDSPDSLGRGSSPIFSWAPPNVGIMRSYNPARPNLEGYGPPSSLPRMKSMDDFGVCNWCKN